MAGKLVLVLGGLGSSPCGPLHKVPLKCCNIVTGFYPSMWSKESRQEKVAVSLWPSFRSVILSCLPIGFATQASPHSVFEGATQELWVSGGEDHWVSAISFRPHSLLDMVLSLLAWPSHTHRSVLKLNKWKLPVIYVPFQRFQNFNMPIDPLGLLLKHRFWFIRSQMQAEILHSSKQMMPLLLGHEQHFKWQNEQTGRLPIALALQPKLFSFSRCTCLFLFFCREITGLGRNNQKNRGACLVKLVSKRDVWSR